MNKRLLPALVLGQLGIGLVASAAPDGVAGESVTLAAPDVAEPSAAPAAQQPPPSSSQAAPPPGQPYYFNGPVYIIPAYPQPAPPPALAPPALPPPPTYQAPPPAPAQAPRPSAPPARAFPHRLGIGGHGGMLWTNQELYQDNLLLSGGGIDLRLRVTDQFIVNGVFDVFKTELGNGNYNRTSYPIQLGLMYYLIPPRARIDFNVYTVASLGLVPSSIGLAVGLPAEQQLRTNEALGNIGMGFDLRFGRLSILADMRALALWRLGDEADVAPLPVERPDGGSGLKQLAVPNQSYGWIFNMGAMLWL